MILLQPTGATLSSSLTPLSHIRNNTFTWSVNTRREYIEHDLSQISRWWYNMRLYRLWYSAAIVKNTNSKKYYSWTFKEDFINITVAEFANNTFYETISLGKKRNFEYIRNSNYNLILNINLKLQHLFALFSENCHNQSETATIHSALFECRSNKHSNYTVVYSDDNTNMWCLLHGSTILQKLFQVNTLVYLHILHKISLMMRCFS